MNVTLNLNSTSLRTVDVAIGNEVQLNVQYLFLHSICVILNLVEFRFVVMLPLCEFISSLDNVLFFLDRQVECQR